jgi:hypothetical protein
MARRSNNNERTDKKAQTIKKRKDALKKKLLKILEQQPVIQTAVSIAGIDKSTYYRWRDEDKKFRENADKAHDEGVKFVNDMMESLIIKTAREGKVTSMIFWLKNHHPDYSEKKFFNHEHHIRQDEILTDERKKQIALAMGKWSEPDDGDERDEDYEIISSEEVKMSRVKDEPKKIQKKQTKKVVPKKAVTKKVQEKPQSSSKSTVAKKIVPKKLK